MYFIKPLSVPQGFTLIEMSIVLVVVGLIIGGILTGQDLINAAKARSQISQIQKFQTATNTFKEKYNYLPGDITAAAALKFGFTARGTDVGQGDGNGVLEGWYGAGISYGYGELMGETFMFWEDLSQVNLIEGNYPYARPSTGPIINGVAQPAVSRFPPANFMSLVLPEAKLGGGNYIYVWSNTGTNYYAMAQPDTINGLIAANAVIPVKLAYAIDAKMDDGLPQSGSIMAWAPMWGSARWAGDGGAGGQVIHVMGAGPGQAEPASGGPTIDSCYDNNSTAGVVSTYSMKTNRGNNTTCALSFEFQ
jgi:prepilin-type N-terminal cleavage/methylation domain-containing protein